MIHMVNPGFRGGSSQPYSVLNGNDFPYLVSQQPLSNYASLRCFFVFCFFLKKKKKADHQQNNLDPCSFCSDAQWEKIGPPIQRGGGWSLCLPQLRPKPLYSSLTQQKPFHSLRFFVTSRPIHSLGSVDRLASTRSFYSCSHPVVNLETDIWLAEECRLHECSPSGLPHTARLPGPLLPHRTYDIFTSRVTIETCCVREDFMILLLSRKRRIKPQGNLPPLI